MTHCCESEKLEKLKSVESREGGIAAEAAGASRPGALGGSPTMIWSALGILVIGLLLYSQLAMNDISSKMHALAANAPVGAVAAPSSAGASPVTSPTASNPLATATSANAASASNEEIWDLIRPQGVPLVYGEELGVSYDRAEEAIEAMDVFDDLTPTSQTILLEGEAQERYIGVTTAISCEYCCGAPAIATATGQAACGCAHSAAMRGLAKYLLKNHPDMSDEDILAELSKWKVVFFPQSSVKKAITLEANSLPVDFLSIASNQYRGLKMPSSGGAGGTALPGQVGGC